MLSPYPLARPPAWDDRRVFAVDVVLAFGIILYAAYQLRHGTRADVFYAGGIIVGITLLRLRDAAVHYLLED